MANNSSSSGGAGFTSLLQIAFIVLKLCKVIDWSWWWVLSPTWISLGFVLVLLLIYGFAKYMERRNKKKRLDKWEEQFKLNKPKSRWQERMEEMQKQANKL